MNQNKYDEALKVINKAVDIEPRDDLLTKRADIYKSVKKYKEAEKDLQEALKISERDDRKALTYSQLADLYNSQDENEKALEAIKELEKLLPTLPDDAFKELPFVYATIGNILFDQGNYDGAIKYFDEALKRDPSQTRLIFERGYACFIKGDREKAQANIKEWLKTNPSTEEVDSLAALANSYMILNKNEKALEYINKAVEKEPDNILTLTDRARIYILMGNKKDAAADINKALDNKPNRKSDRKILQEMMEMTK